MKLIKAITAATSIFMGAMYATTASAGLFLSDVGHQDGFETGGAWTGYNSDTGIFSMKFGNSTEKDGFWLVVSDGPNPKSNEAQYAILYGDIAANRVTAYTYDGENNSNSFQTGELLGTYENVFTVPRKHGVYGYDLTMFTLDVNALNSAVDSSVWSGVELGEQAGIWFHQSEGSDFTYNADGGIASYTYDNQMFIDTAFTNTQVFDSPDCDVDGGRGWCEGSQLIQEPNGGGAIPAPGGLALLLIGLIGMRLRKRA